MNQFWTPYAAYGQDGEVYPFIPQNQPLLCVLDRTRIVSTSNGNQVQERRNLGRLDIWTGKEWTRKGEGTGRYHSVFPLPSRTMPCWEEKAIPAIASHYLILCGSCHTASGSYWRIEPDYYISRIDLDTNGLWHWKVFRRATNNKTEWATIPSTAVIAWTDLPQVARPSN